MCTSNANKEFGLSPGTAGSSFLVALESIPDGFGVTAVVSLTLPGKVNVAGWCDMSYRRYQTLNSWAIVHPAICVLNACHGKM
jgi:hypothetical protein